MSKSPPPVAPRNYSGVRVMMVPGDQPPAVLPVYSDFGKVNDASGESNYTSLLNAERELEIMNHCFDDVERFMTRLQQTAEAQSVLNQRGKTKRSRKSKKNKDGQDDDLLTLKALPPSEEEFVDIFQKIKYSLGLLDRLKSSITQPNAPELLHPIFLPLGLMVKTTGGPALGASVVSPAMTSGAVSLIQDHLTEEEKEMWTSLGPNWTSPCSHLSVSVPPYSPVFLDGWQPQAYDSTGQLFEDPIESQHKQDAFSESRGGHSLQERARQTAEGPGEDSYDGEENGLPPEGERHFCCSYDFVARNSSELSVLQGETLEVIESSKRWWKCRNRFDQIGFVPFNILEPLSALNHKGRASPVLRSESKKTALTPRTKYFSYAAPSPSGTSPTPTSPMRPHSMVLPSPTMQGEDHDRVMIMNDELMQRLAEKRGPIRPLTLPRSADSSTPLNYHSPAAEVEAWLIAKGFNQQTVQSLGILNGAQLFSLNKEELRTVSSEEGVRVYSQIMVQKSLLEDVRKSTELETAMEKQKMRINL
ncbi:epidermal growth factor receptor kinase substrate 8-like protein 1a isoform X1 [Gymnodraco acuticeps]|uniref:Epidermal growth factor receptor kinase substrate 8-like protein 1a isoform X1 n=2 Tax=Gymnodraco acuticeps TaxID=8218 RepID=A0A6P8UBS7_GYMAC|nr:epidermal growth factor receptor kinase substrate 8-like protein 1a isoform X1 [Gymnodraco acuticeps]